MKTAARSSTPSRRRPSPHSRSEVSPLTGSSIRPRRTPSGTVGRISPSSKSSTDQPTAGWFFHRCSLCIRSKSIRLCSPADIASVVFPTRRWALPRYVYGFDVSWPVLTTITSRSLSTRTRSISGNAGGSICRSSVLNSSTVRSLTCCRPH